jgi:hypothetical protein
MKDENAMKGYCYVHALVTDDDVYSYDDVCTWRDLASEHINAYIRRFLSNSSSLLSS